MKEKALPQKAMLQASIEIRNSGFDISDRVCEIEDAENTVDAQIEENQDTGRNSNNNVFSKIANIVPIFKGDALSEINRKYKSVISDLLEHKNVIPKTADTITVNDNSKGLAFAGIDENLQLEVSGEAIDKTVNGKHKDKIKRDVLIDVGEKLKNESVLAIDGFGNNKGKTGAFIDEVDTDGNPILIGIEISKKTGRNNVINEIVTIHGRDKIQGMFYNAYKHKAQIRTNEKSSQWLRTNGLQLPNAGSLTTSNINISNNE